MARSSGFNPNARWDRHIPETGYQTETSCLNCPIEVRALFKSSKVMPEGFIWNNKLYGIKKVNYNWQERRGQEIINYFSVTTAGADTYQISFNNTSFCWRLDKIL